MATPYLWPRLQKTAKKYTIPTQALEYYQESCAILQLDLPSSTQLQLNL